MSDSSSTSSAGKGSPQKRRTAKSGRLWLGVLTIAIVLAVGFAMLNAINEQAQTSPTLFFSMLVTTIPLMMVVAAGVYLVFGKAKPRRTR